MNPAPGVRRIDVRTALKTELLKRHRKKRTAAVNAWDALVARHDDLMRNPFLGTQVPKSHFPRQFVKHRNLWKLDLPGAFRALYTIMGKPGQDPVIAIEWIGDHDEYDRLFGYRKS